MLVQVAQIIQMPLIACLAVMHLHGKCPCQAAAGFCLRQLLWSFYSPYRVVMMFPQHILMLFLASVGVCRHVYTMHKQAVSKGSLICACRYGSIAFLYNFADELTPLFAATPPATGGIGLLASQLAVPLVFCGIVLMAYAVYGYPWFQKKYGAKLSCRFGLIATAPFVLLIPVAHYFAWSVLASQLTLCAILGFKSMGATNAFSGSMILVNNAAPRHALGKVNGAGQMVASFVRAIGPAMAGVVWGFTTQLNLPQKQFLPFAFVSLVSLLTQFVYVFVKQCDCSAT